MVVYYIPIPEEKEDKQQLARLLQGLEPYCSLQISQVLQVRAADNVLDPILRDLAINVVDKEPEAPKAPANGKPASGKKKSAKKGRELKMYEVIATGEKLTNTEMRHALLDRRFDVPTKVRHSRKGMFLVISGDRGHELVEAKERA